MTIYGSKTIEVEGDLETGKYIKHTVLTPAPIPTLGPGHLVLTAG